MLALLLAAAVTASPTPTATVTFGTDQLQTVTGPANNAGNVNYPWQLTRTLYSPGRDAAAVQFCWDAVKYTGCEVLLARPGVPVLTLSNSNVTRLLWSADGQYLIGAGANTVRLWNLNGAVRTAIPTPPLIDPGVTQSASVIGRLWLDRGDVCVAAQDQLFDARGQQKGQAVTTTRYRLPSLKGVTTTTYPLTLRQQEADCKLLTKPI